VVVSEPFLAEIFETLKDDANITLTINLVEQTITNNATGKSESFFINPYKKDCFVNGLDDIDYLLNKKEQIEQYEKAR